MPASAPVTISPEQGQAFDLPAYLARIGMDFPVPVSVEGLARLVRAHRMAIPFENLDIMLGRGISLKPQDIFDKLVHRRRGGYCFEQNALFHHALHAMGFDGRPLMGRVWFRAEEGVTPPRTHQLELVMLDGEAWIADVGFGGSLTPPLPLIEGTSNPDQDGLQFRLRRDDIHMWMLERLGTPSFMEIQPDEATRWQPQYSFTTDPVFDSDRAMGNHWTSTHPKSRFTTRSVAHRITETGFVSLNGTTLKQRDGDRTHSIGIQHPDDLMRVLRQHFAIDLTKEETAYILDNQLYQGSI